jgi:hypothetical protein
MRQIFNSSFAPGPSSSSKIFWMTVSLVFPPGPGFVSDGHAWRSASSFRLHASKIVWLNLPPARVSVFRK